MHIHPSLVLLSFVTLLLSFDSPLMAHSVTTSSASPASSQLLAAQTQTGGNPAPDRGSNRRSFNELQEITFPRLL